MPGAVHANVLLVWPTMAPLMVTSPATSAWLRAGSVAFAMKLPVALRYADDGAVDTDIVPRTNGTVLLGFSAALA